MIKPLDSILFATDLTPDCQEAYNYAVGLALRFKATIYLLYVVETMPENIEGRIRGLLGRHRWEDILKAKEREVHNSLTGKLTSANLLQDVKTFCENVGVGEEECDFQSREIIISAGEVAQTILAKAEENECDLIVLAGREGILTRNLVSDTVKTVLKEASVPVTIVPSKLER